MARPDLGTKRVCPTTGRKFYDLNQDPIVSPYTGEILPRAMADPAPAPRAAPRARKVEEDQEEQVLEPAGDETVSLEDVGSAEEEASAETDDEANLGDDSSSDEFLEEEEESGDVADLIDGDIEDDEEH